MTSEAAIDGIVAETMPSRTPLVRRAGRVLIVRWNARRARPAPDELRGDEGIDAWQAWNAGRAAARDALERADEGGSLP